MKTKEPDLFDPEVTDVIKSLRGEARWDNPETSKEAADMPKGKGAIKVLRFMAMHSMITQLDNEKHYDDRKRALGPRFHQLEDFGLAERIRDEHGAVLKRRQEGSDRELWRITPKGRDYIATIKE